MTTQQTSKKPSVHLIMLCDGSVRVLNLPLLDSSLSWAATSEIKQKEFLKDFSYTNFYDKYTGKKIMDDGRILNEIIVPNMRVLFRKEHKRTEEGHKTFGRGRHYLGRDLKAVPTKQNSRSLLLHHLGQCLYFKSS
jgi:hypothetical protein